MTKRMVFITKSADEINAVFDSGKIRGLVDFLGDHTEEFVQWFRDEVGKLLFAQHVSDHNKEDDTVLHEYAKAIEQLRDLCGRIAESPMAQNYLCDAAAQRGFSWASVPTTLDEWLKDGRSAITAMPKVARERGRPKSYSAEARDTLFRATIGRFTDRANLKAEDARRRAAILLCECGLHLPDDERQLRRHANQA